MSLAAAFSIAPMNAAAVMMDTPATAATPATPLTPATVRRTHTHNPYLRAPVASAPAAACAVPAVPAYSPACGVAPLPAHHNNAPVYSYYGAADCGAATTMMMAQPPQPQQPTYHPMRPAAHSHPVQPAQPVQPVVAPYYCAPAPAPVMVAPFAAPVAAAACELQAYTPAPKAPAVSAPVSIISHKDLSGTALEYRRFTPLDTTSAAAPRRERPSGPFQAPAMPPVINEGLMASSDAASLVDVFVSQLPFDLPLQALRELADTVVPGAPIRIAHAAPHQRRNGGYDGCCFVKLPEADAHRFIAAIHKRVLFDVLGLWVAPEGNDEALADLTAYCAHMQAMRPEARRRVLCRPTPFSAVTAELAKRNYAF